MAIPRQNTDAEIHGYSGNNDFILTTSNFLDRPRQIPLDGVISSTFNIKLEIPLKLKYKSTQHH